MNYLVFWRGVLIASLALSCGSSTPPTNAPTQETFGTLVNPRLADGQPVMMGFDDHHPDCFSFPNDGKDSEEVDCPDGSLQLLDGCRGAKLYATSTGSCTCVPVSEGEPAEVPCPPGIENP